MSRLSEPPSVEELRRRHTITVGEYARIFSVSEDLVDQGCASGQIRHLRRGKRIVFAVSNPFWSSSGTGSSTAAQQGRVARTSCDRRLPLALRRHARGRPAPPQRRSLCHELPRTPPRAE